MQGTEIHDGPFLTILSDQERCLIGIDWKESTEARSDDELKTDLALFAAEVEQRGATGILVDVKELPAQDGAGVQEWWVKNISPRYYVAGVRRFAFSPPEGAAIPR